MAPTRRRHARFVTNANNQQRRNDDDDDDDNDGNGDDDDNDERRTTTTTTTTSSLRFSLFIFTKWRSQNSFFSIFYPASTDYE